MRKPTASLKKYTPQAFHIGLERSVKGTIYLWVAAGLYGDIGLEAFEIFTEGITKPRVLIEGRKRRKKRILWTRRCPRTFV